MKVTKLHPLIGPSILIFLIALVYHQFFLFGKIPIPADTLVGAYFPWLDYKWGYETGVPVKNPPISDVFSQLYLWRMMSIDFMKQGIWPLWNPYSASGSILLANFQSAPFLPFNLLLLLPKSVGWGFYIFIQTLVAALGMYFFIGVYVKKIPARIAAALVFSLAGLMSTYAEFAMAVWAAGMMPWIFYFLEYFLKTKKIRYLILLTLGFTTLYLSGHAQITLYSSGLFLFYLGYRFFIWNEKKFRDFLLLLVFWIFGITGACIQLLPVFDHILFSSIRNSESYSWTFNYGLNSWYQLIRIICADFFGNPTTYNHWDSVSYHEHSTFLGSVTLPLILPLIFKKWRDKYVNFWGIIILSTFFLAFDNPLSKFFYSLPIPLLTNSSASRIFFVMIFSASILTGFGVSKFQQLLDYRKKVFLFCVGLFWVVLFSICLVWTESNFQITKDLKITIKNSLLPIGILIFSGGLIKMFTNKKWILYVIVALIFFDLGRFFIKYNPFSDLIFIYPKTPLIEFLQNQPGLFRIGRADSEILPPNTWMQYRISSVEGYDPLSINDYAKYFNKVKGRPLDDGVSRYMELKEYSSKFIDSLNTKYILAIKRQEDGGIRGDTLNKKILAEKYPTIFEDKNSVVLLNPNAKERTYFVGNLTFVKNLNELKSRIDDPNFDPTEEAVVVGEGSSIAFDKQGEIHVTRYSPNEVVVSTNTFSKQFMVFADSYTKDWELFLSGERQQLYKTNVGLRGIMVPQGSNTFVMKYQPKSFKLGLILTLATLAILAGISIFSIKRKIF